MIPKITCNRLTIQTRKKTSIRYAREKDIEKREKKRLKGEE